MRNIRNQLHQQSINDYLDLANKAWLVEFEATDFGASLSKILELPPRIYNANVKSHFWAFLKIFLQKCEISFILRYSTKPFSGSEVIHLGLIGYWDGKQYAIPLWIFKDMLLGFELVTSNFMILDSEPLTWSVPALITKETNPLVKNPSHVILKDDIFVNQKIYFTLDKGQISIADYSGEFEFFERIAQTKIPEYELED
ncbi:MAG: hypothetical protein ACFE95_05885 [Candidatus Hodarchaeota archaeon]